MKRKVIGLIILTIMMLSGCGDSEKVITGEAANNKAGMEQDGTGSGSEDNKEADVSLKGYLFEVQNITIAINAEAETYIKALGEPVSYYEAASCAFGDLDKVYTYSGFELDTYSLEGKDYVSAVILYDDTVITAEGVSIGDTVEKVEETYGSSETEDGNGIIYVKDDMKLCFIIQDGVVTSIQYLNTILD